MRILLISHTADLNGAELSLLTLARGLSKQPIDLMVMCPEHGPLTATLQSEGIDVEIMRLRRPQRRLAPLFLFVILWLPTVIRLTLWLKREQISVVYNNTLDSLYGPFAAKPAGIPCVWHVREVKPKSTRGRRLFGALLNKLPVVAVFNSQATLRAYADLPPAHWRVIYNGIETPSPQRDASLRQRDLVGFVGQMAAHKRPEMFLEILARVRQILPDTRGIMAGDGPLLPAVRDATARLGLTNAVELCGHVDDLLSIYQSISVLVLTSEREGFGRVVVEAMAAGCAVIAADVGGVSEIIAQGIDGFLTPPDDVEEFVDKVVYLLNHQAIRDNLAEAGIRKVQSEFTAEAYCQQLFELLRSVSRKQDVAE